MSLVAPPRIASYFLIVVAGGDFAVPHRSEAFDPVLEQTGRARDQELLGLLVPEIAGVST